MTMTRIHHNAIPGRWVSAFTLVELLVVVSITLVFVFFAGLAMMRTTRLERNLRTEAFARTQLVLDLQRIARELSLATNINWITPNGSILTDSRNLHSETNYTVRLFYPEETGGVSFETNRISQVSSVRMALSGNGIAASASNRVDLVPSEQRRILSADPVFVGHGNEASFLSFSITNVVSGDEVKPDLVHVTLSSVIRLDAGNGRTVDKILSVDRLVRMWNQ